MTLSKNILPGSCFLTPKFILALGNPPIGPVEQIQYAEKLHRTQDVPGSKVAIICPSRRGSSGLAVSVECCTVAGSVPTAGESPTWPVTCDSHTLTITGPHFLIKGEMQWRYTKIKKCL